jgi:hypothetical protein
MQEVVKRGPGRPRKNPVDGAEKSAPPPAQPEAPKKKTGGFLYRTTTGFTGTFSVVPSRLTGVLPDGSKQISRPIKLKLIRLGIEEGTDIAVGLLDTRNLPEEVEIQAKEIWGDDWREQFDKQVAFKAKSLKLVPINSQSEIQLSRRLNSGPPRILSARTVAMAAAEKPPVPTKDED